MSEIAWTLDILLGLSLLWLAGFSLLARSSTDSILSFIAFGMLMALAWLRLGSADLAIAEAALGGGITGALLISAQRKLMSTEAPSEVTPKTTPVSPISSYGPIVLTLLLTFLLLMVILELPGLSPGLGDAVARQMQHSGVSAEVTAVLLNFRGYDTMLEVSVLLAALLGIWHINVFHLPRDEDVSNPVLVSLVRSLVPVIVLVTGYVLWLGAHAAGGAFQAGALLAGAGVLMLVTRPKSLPLKDRTITRLLIVAGPAVFTLLALWMAWSQGALLKYPEASAGALILIIEMASVFSIGLTLLLLFAGGRPGKGGKQ